MARWSLYCFGVPLKTAILAIGYVAIAESAFSIYAYIVIYHMLYRLDNEDASDVIIRQIPIARVCVIIIMVTFGMTIVSNILLIIGQHKRKPILLIQCFFQTILKVLCNLVAAIVLIVFNLGMNGAPIGTVVLSIGFVYIIVVIGKGITVMKSENEQMSAIISNVTRAEFPERPSFFFTPGMMNKKPTLTEKSSYSNDPFA